MRLCWGTKKDDLKMIVGYKEFEQALEVHKARASRAANYELDY